MQEITVIRSTCAMIPWLLASAAASGLPALAGTKAGDWLIDGSPYKAQVTTSPDGREVTLANGLVRRAIRLTPNAATIAFDNLVTGEACLRSVRPEAMVTLDGHEFAIGGLDGQPVHNFLLSEWIDRMTASPGAFRYIEHRIGPTHERFPWKRRTEWYNGAAPWPPPGVSLDIEFGAPSPGPAGVQVTVHYELYDGAPLVSKWITVANSGKDPVTIDSWCSEILACVEPASLVEGSAESFLPYPRSIHVESEYAFGGSFESGVRGPGFEWKSDPLYETQVHYMRQTPCLLECRPKSGPGVVVASGQSIDSPRVFELLHDSSDRERRGLAQRRMYRMISPWVQENPLIFHAASSTPEGVRAAIDQAAEVGFELVIMTFGSGFDIENNSPEYLAQYKALAEYAHTKGISLGGYSLLASRSINVDSDVVNPATGKPGGFATFGASPCLGSAWGQDYFRTLRNGLSVTGLDVLEHDGSYPGDVCASMSHPGHHGLQDSQWTQWRTISEFYHWCRARGIYLNVPDWYYLSGSSKCGMGYRETNWSLAREQQEIIERQNIYDGTWSKSPSMGWMFVPLMEYHGGGPAATIEPLDAHRDHYKQRLDNLLGAGVQACFRGPRLFDTPATRDMVKDRVSWFKAHRAILESDIVHGRRPDGRDIDWFVHVNPALPTPAMLIVHNPTSAPVQRDLEVDLTNAGLAGNASVSTKSGDRQDIMVDARGRAVFHISVPPRGMSWYLVERTGP